VVWQGFIQSTLPGWPNSEKPSQGGEREKRRNREGIGKEWILYVSITVQLQLKFKSNPDIRDVLCKISQYLDHRILYSIVKFSAFILKVRGLDTHTRITLKPLLNTLFVKVHFTVPRLNNFIKLNTMKLFSLLKIHQFCELERKRKC